MLEVSAGIITSNSKILCFQKGQAKYPYLSNKFEFPGGKVEPGESPKETIIRELSEELEMDISNCDIKFLCNTTFDYPDFSVKLHFFIIPMDVVKYILTEHQKAIWVRIEDLSNLDWAEADKEAIKHIYKNKCLITSVK